MQLRFSSVCCRTSLLISVSAIWFLLTLVRTSSHLGLRETSKSVSQLLSWSCEEASRDIAFSVHKRIEMPKRYNFEVEKSWIHYYTTKVRNLFEARRTKHLSLRNYICHSSLDQGLESFISFCQSVISIHGKPPLEAFHSKDNRRFDFKQSYLQFWEIPSTN